MDAYQYLKQVLDTPELIEKRKQEHTYCRECLSGCNQLNFVGSQVERRQRDFCIERGDPRCVGTYTQWDIEHGLNALLEAGYNVEATDVKEWLNPCFWLSTHVSLNGEPFKPFWYQDRALRCTSEKRLLRMSRRAGKSELLAAYLTYLLFVSPKPYYKVLVVCPQKAQSKEVFDKIYEFLESNPSLASSVKIKQTPYYDILVLGTKNRVRIFTAGSKSGNKAGGVRGQGANLLVLDEMDYLEEDDITTITPILTDIGGGQFIGATTLKGTETLFYKYCHTTNVKEYYVPFRARPDWTTEKEQEARDTTPSQLAWELEYEVRWTGKVDGVFQRMFVMAAFNHKRFKYGDIDYNPTWSYFIGVDWNGENNGTRIMVVGYSPNDNKVYSIHKEVVAYKGWTQTQAINTIVELNRVFKPMKIVIDKGFGQFQDEVIRSVGIAAEIEMVKNPEASATLYADSRLKEIVEVVDFGGKIEIPNLFTLPEGDTKYAKQYLIENLQRLFEQFDICLAQDEELRAQLLDYVVSKYGHKGPVYKAGISGDHDLDALALACFGFVKTYQPEFRISKPVVSAAVRSMSLEQIKEEQEKVPSIEKEKKHEESQKLLPAIVPSFASKGKSKPGKQDFNRSISSNPVLSIRKTLRGL